MEIIKPEGNNTIQDRLDKLEQQFYQHNHADGITQPVWVGKVNQGSANIVIPPSGGVLGEDVSNGDAIRMGMTYAPLIVQQAEDASKSVPASSQTPQYVIAQSFKLDRDFSVSMTSVWADNPNTSYDTDLYADLCADDADGTHPGTVLATTDVTWITKGSDFAQRDCVFSSPYQISANTTYWLQFYHYNGDLDVQYQDSDVYSGGVGIYYDGSTVTNLGDVQIIIYFQEETSKIYKAAAITQKEVDHYMGIANQDGTKGEDANFISIGFKTDYSGLSAGSPYYLSDTPGVISTTPGTITQRIGYAYSDKILAIFK